MSWKIVVPAAAMTVAGLVLALVQYERVAPLEKKPSIRLRVWTGDLPAADLHQQLAAAEAELAEVRTGAVTAQAMAVANGQLNTVLTDYLRQLEQRVQEKQATEWSAVPTQ